jgi:hypothetical protein
MSCPTDRDSGITRCEDAVGNLLPDNFFLEGYTDTFGDPLLLVTFGDLFCDECLTAAWVGTAVQIARVDGNREAEGIDVDRMTRAEILAKLAARVGL